VTQSAVPFGRVRCTHTENGSNSARPEA